MNNLNSKLIEILKQKLIDKKSDFQKKINKCKDVDLFIFLDLQKCINDINKMIINSNNTSKKTFKITFKMKKNNNKNLNLNNENVNNDNKIINNFNLLKRKLFNQAFNSNKNIKNIKNIINILINKKLNFISIVNFDNYIPLSLITNEIFNKNRFEILIIIKFNKKNMYKFIYTRNDKKNNQNF